MTRRALLLVLLALPLGSLSAQRRAPADTPTIRSFAIDSPLLTAFWGRPMRIESAVVLPADFSTEDHLPVVFRIHGFGGSYRSAWRVGPGLVRGMKDGSTPRMLYVFLQAQFSLGHHEFADSVNNGPWGEALTTEFVPALEHEFHAFGAPDGRFLCGHSSGGWSSLWLQVTYPDFFGGTWSTSPDSVDFRDFTGIDVYAFDNAYQDPDGKPIQLVRRNGKFIMSIEQFVRREVARSDHGGQFASFDAVFSPRGEDGRPMPMFDRETGKIDHSVTEHWKRYDIALILREHWATLGPKLAGKLHVYCGTLDTFRLEGALYLMRDELKKLGSDAEIVFAEGCDHGTVLQPIPDLWPDGLYPMIYRAMRERFDAQAK